MKRIRKKWTEENQARRKPGIEARISTTARYDRHYIHMAVTDMTATSHALVQRWSTATGALLSSSTVRRRLLRTSSWLRARLYYVRLTSRWITDTSDFNGLNNRVRVYPVSTNCTFLWISLQSVPQSWKITRQTLQRKTSAPSLCYLASYCTNTWHYGIESYWVQCSISSSAHYGLSQQQSLHTGSGGARGPSSSLMHTVSLISAG